mgnify:CR=1 FL=1
MKQLKRSLGLLLILGISFSSAFAGKTEAEKWIIRSTFANGTHMYNIADPGNSIFMVRPDRSRIIPMSYDSPITTEYWDEDGSQAYKQMFERLEKEEMVLEKAPGSRR